MKSPINIESTLERLAFMARREMAPAWSRTNPEGWKYEYERRMTEMGAVLGAEFKMLSEARQAGWDVPPPDELTEHGLAMRLPDGRIGHHMPDKRYHNAPPKKLGDPIREHITAFLKGKGGGIRQPGLAQLPEICRDVLRADGLDPDAVERLGALTKRIAVTVHGRHHVADLSLPSKIYFRETERFNTGEQTYVPYDLYEWQSIKMVLSKTPAVHVLNNKLTAKVSLPEVIASSLPGRPASIILEHPALEGYTIAQSTRRASGFTVTLSKD